MTAARVPRTPRVLADLLPGARVRDVVLVLAGTAWITIAGFIAVPLPFTPVPLSLATFAVLLTGATLGPVRGTASAGLYLVLGLCGVPMFAGGASGWAFASFGYVVGFVLAAAIVGGLADRRADRHVGAALGLGAVGSLLIYVCGVGWLVGYAGIPLPTAVVQGVLPFLVGDAIKIVANALLLPTAWKLVGERSQGRR